MFGLAKTLALPNTQLPGYLGGGSPREGSVCR